MAAATEFLDLAKGRAFDGSRLRNLREFFGGLRGAFTGFGVTIDDPDDLGTLAEKYGPLATTLAKWTPTPIDDQAVAWLVKALESQLVRGIVFTVFFSRPADTTKDDTDDDLLDALQSAALKAVA